MKPLRTFQIAAMGIGFLFAASTSHASLITAFVDFGTVDDSGVIGGNYWNSWSPGDNLDLLDAGTQLDTGWNLDSTTSAATNDRTSINFVPSFSGAPSPFGEGVVVGDGLNLTSAQGVRNVRLRGLDSNAFYNLVLYAGRDSAQVRVTGFTVTGDSVSLGSLQTSGPGSGTAANYNNDDPLSFGHIAPDNSGEILIEYTVTAGDFGYLNALTISTAVPEPATTVALGIFLGGCAFFRRRRAIHCRE